ncbi:MAG TPA: PKD domain-containing protein [Flavobacteriales bacterium]|jgi:gliding motility-associated-like protein|nr:gliding motility-associated C-terminal domain-containing protein [Flavobacteriales bacterium]MBK7484156.1 gliding motility-associated C-terminal domain-containing protein [Flavobacteriales bacterium]MBK8709242.1 gliding motility-associated C-terminal domain-containing protein [Flavobacteriales bacterium]MBP8876486.1 gliding motility-associated C-terminal domain-containing protein [Flavobacteriales bacterium]MBP9178226.1 gliding motility-associated C-terminal domain-containing protein [Flavob
MHSNWPYHLFLLLGLLLSDAVSASHSHGEARPRFTRNIGQWEAPVLFRTAVNGATVFLERNGASWVKYAEGTDRLMHDAANMSIEEWSATPLYGHAWRTRFYQPSPDLAIEANGVRPGYENFFLGNDPRRWKGHVDGYDEVIYRGVWPGVDVRYYSHEGHLKYDVLLAPGSASDQVAFQYIGTEGERIDPSGDLIITTSVGEVMEMRPVAFYADGAREPIACGYRIQNGVLRFSFPTPVDQSRPVVIDPVLIASTLSGATGSSNYGHCATYDGNDNIYSGARNFGPTYPATVGAFQTNMGGGGTDMSFSKYNPDGSQLIWASYLGGSAGENPHSMIVNALGELCILGSSNSSDFPVTAGAFDTSLGGQTDIVVTHVSADGATLIGSTFVGGNSVDGLNGMGANYGEQYRGEIYLDGASNILVVSFSSSPDFPTTTGCFQSVHGGGQDGVVFAVTPDCSSMVHSTFLGGSEDDNALGIRVAQDGAILVTGSTESSDLPVTAGSSQPTYIGGDRDGYVVRLAPDLSSMVAGTFFGTDEEDRSYFLDTDLNGDVWIYGQTDGSLPISPVGTYGQPDAPIFIAKLSGDLSDLLITTTIGPLAGGFGGATPVAFLVDVCDNIYISSYNSTDGLPTTPDALYTDGSFYLAAFDVDLIDILFGTYYGGSHVDGGTSRFDKNGVVYQGVCSGMGSLQTTPWAWATGQTIGWDIGVFKIDFGVAGVNAAGASAVNTGCAPITVDFSNESSGDTWFWDFGDGSPMVEAFEPSHTYTQPGEFTVLLIALDSLACNLADTTLFLIEIGEQQVVAADMEWFQVEDCTQLLLNATSTSTGDPLDLHWILGDGTEFTTAAISHVFDLSGTYDVMLIVRDPFGCGGPDTLATNVTVAPIDFDFQLVDRALCQGMSVELDASSIEGTRLWSTGATSPTIVVDEVGEYWVTISNAAGCVGTDTVLVADPPVYDLVIEEYTCPDDPVLLRIPLDGAAAYLWDDGSTRQVREVESVADTYSFAVIDRFGCTFIDSAKVSLLDQDVRIFTPNAFSPNGDGINDTFQFQGYGDQTLELTIFDRWGERLYQTLSMDKPWDGTYNGQPVKNDVYVYVLKYTGRCTGNEQYERKGHVTVVR